MGDVGRTMMIAPWLVKQHGWGAGAAGIGPVVWEDRIFYFDIRIIESCQDSTAGGGSWAGAWRGGGARAECGGGGANWEGGFVARRLGGAGRAARAESGMVALVDGVLRAR